MTWDTVLVAVTGGALALLMGLYVVGVIRREQRGPDPVLTTLATSRPWWGMLMVGAASIAGVLVVVRLAALS
jgi:hypothetical protein